MMKRTAMIAAVAIVLLGLCLTVGRAYWIDDGNRVSFNQDDEFIPRIVDGGNGHALIAYIDEFFTEYHQRLSLPRVQKIDRRGDIRWDSAGVLCTSTGVNGINEMEAISDGDGGIIVAWTINPTHSNSDILFQRISHDGDSLWADVDTPVTPSAFEETDIAMCEDGAGGGFIVWRDNRTGTYRLYIQPFDRYGHGRLSMYGMSVSLTSSTQTKPKLVLVETGTVIVMWKDDRNGNQDLYAQAIDTTGTRLWVADEAVCTESSDQTAHEISSDGAGGAVAVWMDYRNSKFDIFAQRLLLSGGAFWPTDGYGICTHSFVKASPLGITRDNTGGTYIIWRDYRNLVDSDVYAQHVDASGKRYWTVDGIPVCAVTGHTNEPMALPDGEGGVVVAWTDQRAGNRDIYAQRLDTKGDALWTANGELICRGILDNDLGYPVSINEGARGVFVAWQDDGPEENDADIRACYFDMDGDPGMPEPRIMEAGDLPGDEGGWVRLRVKASTYDDPYAFYDNTTGYNVWRRIDPAASYASGDTGFLAAQGSIDIESLHEIITDPERSAGLRLSAEQAAAFALPHGEWESLGFNAAMMLGEYNLTVPTRTDSTDSGNAYEYFVVTAHTINPLAVFVSDIDTAYSVDNLAPAAPLSLAGEQSFSPEGLRLTWDDNNEADLTGYRVYRGTSSDFSPSPTNLVDSPSESELLDVEWTWDGEYWYKVAAVDRHGNESHLAVFGPDMVTGDDPMPIPDATFLAQNFPNPFNPNTTIAFGLKTDGFVNLSVYDAAGRLVTTLINESRPAGQYATVWNGKAQNGSPVASGVYFYRLAAGNYIETRKMILLR